MKRKSVLGPQALHLIHESGATLRDIELRARQVLRRKVEAASHRPAPGTSDLLGRPMEVHTAAGIDGHGNLRTVDTYDLVGMAPIHLKKGDS